MLIVAGEEAVAASEDRVVTKEAEGVIFWEKRKAIVIELCHC